MIQQELHALTYAQGDMIEGPKQFWFSALTEITQTLAFFITMSVPQY